MVVLEARVPRMEVRALPVADLEGLQAQWDELRERSDADALFMSWAWQSAWWRCFAPRMKLELLLLAAYCDRGRLIGLAPLYVHAARRCGLRVRRVEFIGNVYRGPLTMRTEYLDFIADRSYRDAVTEAFLRYLAAHVRWDELIVSDIDTASPTYRAVRAGALAPSLVRTVNTYTSYCVPSGQRFEEFLARLRYSARRRLYLQRSHLQAMGPVEIKTFGSHDFEQAMHTLDSLHRQRWGDRYFHPATQDFCRALLSRAAGTIEPRMSVLLVGGRPVSALYELATGERRYNIQAGFDANFARGLSIAKLHWGYLIEEQLSSGSATIDLLVGGGRKEDFKREFADPHRHLVALQIVRSRLFRLLYRILGQVQSWRMPAGGAISAAPHVSEARG